MTIDGKPIYKSEFERVFKKNLDLVKDEDKTNVDKYLQMFIDYKLKVLEAEAEGLDTIKSFSGQYKIYKSQLAQKYMMDTKVTDHLLQQAYSRLQQEVNASHILVRVGPDAPPQDTLKAYKKIEDIRKQLMNGADFDKTAHILSEDPSAKSNSGHLGWFGVFTMIYPFENAAYNTPVGEISEPIRTRFGYHLVKVNERRKDEGKVSVAHILINIEKDSTEAKKRIDKIYEKLKKGADFANMAKQYSEDKTTADKGGKLDPFKHGTLKSPKFESIAFGLSENDPLSKPFKTKYGWHLLKLLKHYPVKSFDKERGELKRRIEKDMRSEVIKDSLLKKLKNQYTLFVSEPGLKFFKDKLGDNFIETASDVLPKKDFISIKGDGATYTEFFDYLKKFKHRHRLKALNTKTLDKAFFNYKNDYYFRYEKKHLAEFNPEYAHVMEDYRSGLLIFALMQKNVWEKAKTDSVVLKTFYNQHKADFYTQTRYNGDILSADDKKTAKSIEKELKRDRSIEAIKKDNPEVIITSGKFTDDNSKLPENFKTKPGVSKPIEHNGVFVVMKTKSVETSHQESFKEAKGKVINAYQDQLEKLFIKKLRNEHNVVINQKTVNSLKVEFE